MTRAPFRIIAVDHIGIAPNETEPLIRLFGHLGLLNLGDEVVASQKTHTHFFSAEKSAEATKLEILSPSPSGEGPIARYLEKKKSGIHHIALQIDGIDKAVESLKAAQFSFTSESPQPGAHGSRVIFIHPQSTGGILIELVEKGSP